MKEEEGEEEVHHEEPTALDRLTTRLPPRPEVDYASVPKPPGRVPPGPLLLPEWRIRPMDSKLPVVPAPKGTILYARDKMGEGLTSANKNPAFDLTDPLQYQTKIHTIYEALHDPKLKSYFQQPLVKKHLQRQNLITEDGLVKCSLKQFNDFRAYLNRKYQHAINNEINLRDQRDRFERKQLEMLQQCKKVAVGQDSASRWAEKAKRIKLMLLRKRLKLIQRGNELRLENAEWQERRTRGQHLEKLRIEARKECERKLKESKKKKMVAEYTKFRCATLRKWKEQDKAFKAKIAQRKFNRECNREEQRLVWLDQKRHFQMYQIKENERLLIELEEQRRKKIEDFEEYIDQLRTKWKEMWGGKICACKMTGKEMRGAAKKARMRDRLDEGLFISAWDMNASLLATLNAMKRRAASEKLLKEAEEKAALEKEFDKEQKARKKQKRLEILAEQEEELNKAEKLIEERMKLKEDVAKLMIEKPEVYNAVKELVEEIVSVARSKLVTKKSEEVTSGVMDMIRARSTQLMGKIWPDSEERTKSSHKAGEEVTQEIDVVITQVQETLSFKLVEATEKKLLPKESLESSSKAQMLPAEEQEYITDKQTYKLDQTSAPLAGIEEVVEEFSKKVVTDTMLAQPTSDVTHQDVMDWATRALVDHVLESVHEELKILSNICSERKHTDTVQLVSMGGAQPDVSMLAMALVNKVLHKTEIDVKAEGYEEEHMPPNKKVEDVVADSMMQFLDHLRWPRQATDETEDKLPSGETEVLEKEERSLSQEKLIENREMSPQRLSIKNKWQKTLEPNKKVSFSKMQKESGSPVPQTMREQLSEMASDIVNDIITNQTHQLMEVEDKEMKDLLRTTPRQICSDGVSPVASRLVDKILEVQVRRLSGSDGGKGADFASVVQDALELQGIDLLEGAADEGTASDTLVKAVTDEYNEALGTGREKALAASDFVPGIVKSQASVLLEEVSGAGVDRKALVTELLRQLEGEGVSSEQISKAADHLLESVIEMYNTCIVQEAQQTLARKEILKVILTGGLESSTAAPKHVSVVAALLIFEMIKMQMQALLLVTGKEEENQQKLHESITLALQVISSSQGMMESVASNLIEKVLKAHTQSLLVGADKLLKKQEFRNAAATIVTMSAMADPKTEASSECVGAVADLLVDEILRIQTDLMLRDVQEDLMSEGEMQEMMKKALKDVGKGAVEEAVKEFMSLQKASLNREAEGALSRREAIVKSITNALKSSNQEEAYMVAATILVNNFLHLELKAVLINSHEDETVKKFMYEAGSEKLGSIPKKWTGSDMQNMEIGMTISCAQRQALIDKARPIMEQKEILVKKAADSIERVAKEFGSDPKKMAKAIDKLLQAHLDTLTPGRPKLPDFHRGSPKKTSVAYHATPKRSREISAAAAESIVKKKRSPTESHKPSALGSKSSSSCSESTSNVVSDQVSPEASLLVEKTLFAAAKKLVGDICTQLPPSLESSNGSSPNTADINSVSASALNVVATTMVDYLLKDVLNEESQMAINASPHQCYCSGMSQPDNNEESGPCKDQCYCTLPDPDVVPHYNGEPLPIDPSVVSKGLRAISIQHFSKEGVAEIQCPSTSNQRLVSSGFKESGGIKQSGSNLCAPPRELLDRNTFTDLHRPEVSTLDLMRGKSAISIERLFREHEMSSPDLSVSGDKETVQEIEKEQSSINLNEDTLQQKENVASVDATVVQSEENEDQEEKQEVEMKVQELKPGGEQAVEEVSSTTISAIVEDSVASRTPSTGMDILVPLKQNEDRLSGEDSTSEPSLNDTSSQMDNLETGIVRAICTSRASLNTVAEDMQSKERMSRRSSNVFDVSRSISGPDLEQEPLDRRFSSCGNSVKDLEGSQGSQAVNMGDSQATLITPSYASSKISISNPFYEYYSSPASIPPNQRIASAPLDDTKLSALPKTSDSVTAMSLPGDFLTHDTRSQGPSGDSSIRNSQIASPDTPSTAVSPSSSSSSQATKRSLGKSLSDLVDRIRSFVSEMGSTSSSSKGSLKPPESSSTLCNLQEDNM